MFFFWGGGAIVHDTEQLMNMIGASSSRVCEEKRHDSIHDNLCRKELTTCAGNCPHALMQCSAMGQDGLGSGPLNLCRKELAYALTAPLPGRKCRCACKCKLQSACAWCRCHQSSYSKKPYRQSWEQLDRTLSRGFPCATHARTHACSLHPPLHSRHLAGRSPRLVNAEDHAFAGGEGVLLLLLPAGRAAEPSTR